MRRISLIILLCASFIPAFAQNDKDFPPRPSPPKLVNDMAGVMSSDEESLLEQKVEEFEQATSNEITIVTVRSIGEYDVADYTTQLGNRWGVGKASRNNGVLILAAINDHRMNISVGKGLEGALTDLVSGRIIRNEMAPAFREGNYYRGFDRAVDAVSAATKGEYKGEEKATRGRGRGGVVTAIIIFLIIMWIIRRMGGGGGGGTYMSRRGWGGFGGGFLTGSMLGGGWGGGGGGWGGGSSGGGGFGGFGGGSFGGGGASGSW